MVTSQETRHRTGEDQKGLESEARRNLTSRKTEVQNPEHHQIRNKERILLQFRDRSKPHGKENSRKSRRMTSGRSIHTLLLSPQNSPEDGNFSATGVEKSRTTEVVKRRIDWAKKEREDKPESDGRLQQSHSRCTERNTSRIRT
ncbi:hypothetical protein GW17_00005916 [Ensete ventricosum]|nr:hypothetical protein GW17_00005916 [Ensete ventricosum]